MRWKLLTLIAALVLVVTTSAPPSKVAAQGLVEYALILVLVPVGPGELAEFHWESGSIPGKPQMPRIPPGDIVTWTYRVTNTGDGTCTQTISASVVAKAGLNTLKASISGRDLFLNGELVVLDQCFAEGGSRNVIEVGRLFPPGLAAQGAADPNALAYKLQRAFIKSWAVSGIADGDTRAASRSVSDGYWILLKPLSPGE